MSPVQAAQNASKCASLYCDSRSIDSIALFNESNIAPRECRRRPIVYLAGPFFSLAQRFLIEETRAGLLKLGAEVFSPMHEVGFDLPVETIAKEDLRGLERCSVVLALITDLDPGTIFEIGFARAKNIPVVTFGEGVKEEHLTMLIGTECMYSQDFCSALYNAVWAGM
jgi:nucleoside 2-deoxyribosyltransferase